YTPEHLRRTTTGRNFRSTAQALADAHAARRLSSWELESWVDEERREVTGYLRRALRPDVQVREPLRQLARTHRLAVVSSSASSRVDACLEATELADLFATDVRFSAEDSLPAPTSKPDPAIYAFALEALALGPDAAVAVEDSVPGVASAVAAGIATFGNLQFVLPREREARRIELARAGAAGVFESWADLAADLSPQLSSAADPIAG
ncbi:MAG TPA: HAD family phosphatase, partial [Solirubrobacterales bacterium]|nr:HAD family phosphatase [Solirubrobacterales bacterium]